MECKQNENAVPDNDNSMNLITTIKKVALSKKFQEPEKEIKTCIIYQNVVQKVLEFSS